MKKIFWINILLMTSYLSQAQLVNLIPYPQKVTVENKSVNFSKGIVLENKAGNLAQKGINLLNFTTSLVYTKPADAKKETPKLIFSTNNKLQNEAYTLVIDLNKIEISAGTVAGFTAGSQTLVQLIGTYSKWQFPVMKIEDEPRYKWRGMHLDVCRHFFSVVEIKKLLRAMSFYKLNIFHWHLTDDQGWRIEIKKYPKLTEIGSIRKETAIGHSRAKPVLRDGIEYKGFYTQEEIKDIVAFADTLNITVVPEIELPGHAQAAITAYPYLGCTKKQIGVWTDWGVSSNIFEPSDSTFTFLQNIMDEVITLFPSPIIHIGGDEAAKDQWKDSKYVQDKIKSLKLKDEHELQNWFITKMEKYLNSKGKNIIGWDEILEGGLAPNAAVMSWRGEKGGIAAAKMKHNVVMSPGSHCYLDGYQATEDEEPMAIGGFLPLSKVYQYNPTPDSLKGAERNYIMGAQGNLWTEYISSNEHLEYMAFPRIIALAEVCWTMPENKKYDQFVTRLKYHRRWLMHNDIKFCPKWQ